MAITPVQHATQVNVANSAATSFTITLTGAVGGNAIVGYGVFWQNSSALVVDTVTDGGNSFTLRTGVAESGTDFGARAAIGYAVNITGGARTVSFNCSSTIGSTYYVLGCSEYSGVATSTPEDTFDGNDNQSITTLDVNAGPITTTDAGDLLVGLAGLTTVTDAALTWSSPASWTNRYRQEDSTTYVGMDAGEWLPGSVQTTYTPQWAHDNASGELGAGLVVALKPTVDTPITDGPALRVTTSPLRW